MGLNGQTLLWLLGCNLIEMSLKLNHWQVWVNKCNQTSKFFSINKLPIIVLFITFSWFCSLGSIFPISYCARYWHLWTSCHKCPSTFVEFITDAFHSLMVIYLKRHGLGVATPLWAKCETEAHTPKSGKLESSGTPENSELDCRGQISSHLSVLGVIEKVLKCRCPKWPRIGHLDICSPSYAQKKGRESNCQFDSRPLKVGNQPAPDVR
jgi:hypothetical protein